jgi:ribosomal protein L29
MSQRVGASDSSTAFADLSDEDLVHRVLQVERDLVSARFEHSMNQLANTASLRDMRAEIARLRTEARRRERDGGLGKNALLARHRGTFAAPGRAAPAGPVEKGRFLSGIVDKLTGKE